MPRGEQPVSWWKRLLRTDDRKARRAYRRSLPPLYRWRRVAIVCALVIAVTFGFAIVGKDPAAWAQQRWYDVNGTLVQVAGVEAKASPEGSDLDGFPAQALVDADPGTAWATTWRATKADIPCGGTPSGQVKVTFPETRLRELRIRPGLKDPSARSLQQQPEALDLTLPDGTCHRLLLTQLAKEQEFDFDSEEPVEHVVVSIPTVYANTDERAQDVVAVRMLALFSRP